METKVLLALLLVAVLVIAINGLLYLALRRDQSSQHIRMWQKAARRARSPWKKEDEQLSELSELVSDLQENPDPED